MSIISKLKEDLKVAIKEGNRKKSTDIRTIIGEIERSAIKDVSDEFVEKTIKTLHKLGESLSDEEDLEWLILLNSYLPKKATEDEIIIFIRNNVDFDKLINKNMAIGIVTKHFGNTVDGNTVKNIINEKF